jgi:hypothetical protein
MTMTLKQRVEHAEAEGFTPAELARAAGVSSSAAAQWKTTTQRLKGDSALGLAEFTGWPVVWWQRGIGPPPRKKDAARPPGSGVAYELSVVPIDHPVPKSWGDVLKFRDTPLPRLFVVAVPDDALAPSTPKGTPLIFSSDAKPEPGVGVLVADRDGTPYVRRYAQGRSGAWLAQAEGAYITLESERDGLQILAVATGRMDGRV